MGESYVAAPSWSISMVVIFKSGILTSGTAIRVLYGLPVDGFVYTSDILRLREYLVCEKPAYICVDPYISTKI